ncbi:MAG TPA: hypothetical protein VN682_26375 [Terriglobales bacterium]|jgi:hypothetical protein|nr:hypothetical protein [Terriglobales bacterium]
MTSRSDNPLNVEEANLEVISSHDQHLRKESPNNGVDMFEPYSLNAVHDLGTEIVPRGKLPGILAVTLHPYE